MWTGAIKRNLMMSKDLHKPSPAHICVVSYSQPIKKDGFESFTTNLSQEKRKNPSVGGFFVSLIDVVSSVSIKLFL